MFDNTTSEFAEDINTRALLSDVKFYEGYSRYDEIKGCYESWSDAVGRVMAMHRGFYGDAIKSNPSLAAFITEATEAYDKRRVLGAQRALQFGGEQILKHQMRMYNCTSSHLDRFAFFGEFFYILLCGAGAGFSVQKHHIAALPMIRPRTKQTKAHVIHDSIEGWATAANVLLSSFFIGGGVNPEYEGRRVYFDGNDVRKKGAPISGGFKAPGPEPLLKALNLIERLLTERAEEGILRPIDCYDVCMHMSDAVLAGGVRRAATICLFSKDDHEMLTAKTGNWFEENPQRARSNNSAVLLRSEITEAELLSFTEHIKEFGEPGFVLVDSYEHCFNPCVEIGMYPRTESGVSGWQGCNLTEINGAMCDTPERFWEACRAAAVLGTLQAGYTDFKFLGPVSKDIFEREALLGVSLTGWMNNPHVLFDKEVLRKGAAIVLETNERVAAMLGIRAAARATCVKPAGNASVLLGTASGVHKEHAPRFIRNIQVNKIQEVCRVIQDTNPYMIEESIWSASNSDYIISFPVVSPPNSLFKDDSGAIDFLEKIKFIQEHWVEGGTVNDRCVDPTVRHNVSNTVQVRRGEWEEVAKYIHQNRGSFTGITLIGTTGDKDYYQAPFIAVPTPGEIVNKYGAAALFASGLIVDACTGFKNLWEAISISQFNHDKSNQELRDIRAEWVRRFKKFSEAYFSGDQTLAGYCLKDVYMVHKWTKIQKNFKPINIEDSLTEQRSKDIDTMGAMACAAGGCEI